MRDGKGGNDRNQRPETPEWDDQTKQEEQVIGSVEDVEESENDESNGRLMPSRIQSQQPWIAHQLEGSNGAAGRYQPKRGDGPNAQSPPPHVDRETRCI